MWRKSLKGHKPRLGEHIREAFAIIEKAMDEGNACACASTLTGMNSEELCGRFARPAFRLNPPGKAVKKPVSN